MKFYYCSTCKEMTPKKKDVKCEEKCKLYSIEINDKLLQTRVASAEEIGKADVHGVIKKVA